MTCNLGVEDLRWLMRFSWYGSRAGVIPVAGKMSEKPLAVRVLNPIQAAKAQKKKGNMTDRGGCENRMAAAIWVFFLQRCLEKLGVDHFSAGFVWRIYYSIDFVKP